MQLGTGLQKAFSCICQAVVSMHLYELLMSKMYVQEQNHQELQSKLFPLNAEGWIMRKKGERNEKETS